MRAPPESVEGGLALPAFEQDDPARFERIGGERVLEAPVHTSRRAHPLVALGDERIAQIGIDSEHATDDDHQILLAVENPILPRVAGRGDAD